MTTALMGSIVTATTLPGSLSVTTPPIDRSAALRGNVVRLASVSEALGTVTETAGVFTAYQVIATSERRDRYGDIVRAGGAKLENFMRNPVLQLQHGFTSAPCPVIGKCANPTLTKSATGFPAIAFDLEFAPTALGREIATLWAGGYIRATSIGFQPLGPEYIRVIGPDGLPIQGAEPGDFMYGGMPPGYGLEFMGWELLEHSVVPVPANADAVARIMRSAGLTKRGTFTGAAWDRATFHRAACPGGHCPGCAGEMEPEEMEPAEPETDTEAVAEATPLPVAIKSAEPIVFDGRVAIATAARVLKDTSIEVCPECLGLVAYYRPEREFVAHDVNGKRCIGKVLPTTPSGPSAKDVIKAGRVLRQELKDRAACAHDDIKKILDAATVAAKLDETEDPADEAKSAEPAATPSPAKADTSNADPGHREATTDYEAQTDALLVEIVTAAL